MAKQTVKAQKAETPDAVKAKPPVKALVVQMPNAKAISAGVGLEALRMVAQAAHNDEQILALQKQKEELVGGGATGSQRGKAQVMLAMAIHHAGNVDQAFRADLPKVWSKSKRDTNFVLSRVRMAVGITRADGSVNDEAAEIMLDQPTDSVAIKARKESIRSNFSTMLSKATKVALHVLDKGLTMEVDKTTGFLRLTDTRKTDYVKKQFGAPSILLNENQNQKILDKKGKAADVSLKVKPSFTEVMRQAGTDHGVAVVPRTDSRTRAVANDEYIIRVAADLQTAVTKWNGEVPDNVRKALEALQSAIVKRLS